MQTDPWLPAAKIAAAALVVGCLPFTASAKGFDSLSSTFELAGVIVLFLAVIAAFFRILAYQADKSPASSTGSRSNKKHHKKTRKKYQPKHS